MPLLTASESTVEAFTRIPDSGALRHGLVNTVKMESNMIFALLMVAIAMTTAAIWRGHSLYALLFAVSALAAALVLVLDINTPLTLAF